MPASRVVKSHDHTRTAKKYCVWARGSRAAGRGLRNEFKGAGPKDRSDPITQLVTKKIIAVGRLGFEDPAEISKVAVQELGGRDKTPDFHLP